MEQYIMAIDQGTTSTRAILFDRNSNIKSVAQKEIETYYPKQGWVEQNANDIWASTIGVMFEVLAKSDVSEQQIVAIGITNQRETTVVWDKQTGQPISFAIVWQSRQSNGYIEALKEEGKETWIKEKTGLLLDPYFSASKIRFILDHVEGAQARAEQGELLFGTIDSWLVWKLTQGGCHISDVSNASRTMLMNIETLTYDDDLLALWNIPRVMLPEIRDSSEVYGYTKGLFETAIPIAGVIGDQQASLFGQTCFQAGDIKNTYGTGCFLLMNTGRRRIVSNHGLLTCVGWRIGQEITYVLEGSVFVAGAAIQWLRDGLKIIDSSKESQKRSEMVDNSHGVYVVPSFTGLGAPYWNAKATGAMFGLTRGTSQEHIIRATLESLAYQTYDVIKAMREDSGLQIQNLQVDGGASQNDFLIQFQADLLQCVVKRSSLSETTALGAAYVAGLAIGFWKNKQEINDHEQTDQMFHPMMNEDMRVTYLQGWEKAMKAVQVFSEE